MCIPIQCFERETQFPFEFGDVAALIRFDEANREALLAGSRSASGAVGVVLQVLGQLTVDHERQPFHINAPGGDVGRNQKAGAFLFESPHHLVAIPLAQVALQHVEWDSALVQLFAQHHRPGARAAENHPALRLLRQQKVRDPVVLVVALADHIAVRDVAIHDLRFLDFDDLRIRRHAVRDESLDLLGERRRKQPCAASGCRHLGNADHFVTEPHAQHFVRFVQHEMLHGVELEGAELQQIKEPAGRRHDDVRRALQPLDLQVDFVATTGDFDEDLLRGKFGVLKQVLADLLGEFTRRREDEALQRRVVGIDLREQGQAKRRRLAGPGLRLRDQIPAVLDEKRNCVFLNGGRSGDAERIETTDQIRWNAEF